MKYKNSEIGIPTLEQIQEFINRMGFKFTASEVFDYFSANNWLTKKGEPIKTLESIVNVYNSLWLRRHKV